MSSPTGPNYSWQPQPGNYNSAPSYGQPPRKSRAGLIIALIVVFVIVALGAVGLLAFRLVQKTTSSSPDPVTSVAPPASSPTPQRSVPRPTKTTLPPTPQPPPTRPPTSKPPTPTPARSAAELARRFVAQLNANNPTAAAALACQSSKQLIPTLMQVQLQPPTKLTAGTPIGQQPTFVIPLTGTTKGSTVQGSIVIQRLGTEPLCVRVFQVTPH